MSNTPVYGSLMNHLHSNGAGDVEVKVGDGATELMWTDRHAFTVVQVKSAKTIVVQRDKVTRTDANGMSETQSYSYEPDVNGELVTLRMTKRGWSSKGRKFRIGKRSEYHDFSF